MKIHEILNIIYILYNYGLKIDRINMYYYHGCMNSAMSPTPASLILIPVAGAPSVRTLLDRFFARTTFFFTRIVLTTTVPRAAILRELSWSITRPQGLYGKCISTSTTSFLHLAVFNSSCELLLRLWTKFCGGVLLWCICTVGVSVGVWKIFELELGPGVSRSGATSPLTLALPLTLT